MLLSRDAIAVALERCSAADFYRPSHGHIFSAITSLYGQGEPADAVTVAEELRRAGVLDDIGGTAALVALQSNTPAISSAGRYAADRRGARTAPPADRRRPGDRRDRLRPARRRHRGGRPGRDDWSSRSPSAGRPTRSRRCRSCSARASTASRSSTAGTRRSPACRPAITDLDEQPRRAAAVEPRRRRRPPLDGKDRVRARHGRATPRCRARRCSSSPSR